MESLKLALHSPQDGFRHGVSTENEWTDEASASPIVHELYPASSHESTNKRIFQYRKLRLTDQGNAEQYTVQYKEQDTQSTIEHTKYNTIATNASSHFVCACANTNQVKNVTSEFWTEYTKKW